MKNRHTLLDKNTIINGIINNWATSLFKDYSYKENNVISETINSIANNPDKSVSFYEMTSDVEYSNFSAWWGCIAHRIYDNNYIKDLYYLHELSHIANRIPKKDISFIEWYKVINQEELTASITTEAMVYFDIPELREKTFSEEIWVDRFIYDKYFSYNRRVDIFQKLAEKRLETMLHPDIFNYNDIRIHDYSATNRAFCEIYRPVYKQIENATATLSKLELINWIDNLESTAINNVPFYTQAVEFYKIYKRYD